MVRKNLRAPIILASNHKSSIDMFLIEAALPLFSGAHPFRFMAEYSNFKTLGLRILKKTGFLFLLYGFFGAFPSYKGKGVEAAIQLPMELIRKGNSIFIFPEGTRVFEDHVGLFKRGVGALAVRTGVAVLPVAIRWSRGFLRPRIQIAFGYPLSIDRNHSYEKAALRVQNEVEGLYEQLKMSNT